MGFYITYIEVNHLEEEYNKYCIAKYGNRQLTPAEICISLKQFYDINNQDVPF